MKSTIWKSIFREIRESLGRFLAILAIVALGVGFFAGLKVTQPAMLETTERYYEKTVFYDYRLLSTVGFGKDDVEAFRNQEGVAAAEGALEFDVLCEMGGGNNKVLKAHSITEEINKLVVVDGLLPTEADECVVDANLYDASWIGKKIVLSENNTEDDLEHFAYQEYTITGIVQSPIYIQYERGTTSLGNGQVSGFFFLLPEGFAEDYYTEIYVAFDESFSLYSDDYQDFIDEKTSDWEQIAGDVARERYVTVMADAKKQLAEGKEELADKKEEAEAELADAKEQLEKAKQQIDDGEKQLADAKEELEKAPDILAEKEAKLDAAEQELLEQEQKLNAGEIALGIGVAQGIGQISDAMGSMDIAEAFGSGDASQSAGAGMSMSTDAAKALTDAQSLISSARQQIADGRAQIEAAKRQIADGRAQIEAAKRQLTEGKVELAEHERELREAREEYEKGKKEYEEGLEEFQTKIAEAEQKIADGEKALAELEAPKAYVLGRDTNVGYVCFESDSGIVDGVAVVFPVFFFLVAALVCMTTMNRMVEEERTQIGVLKALGYSEWTIMFKYIFYSGAAAVLGCLIGFFCGTFFFPKVIWEAYGMMYQVDSLLYLFDWKMAVISLAASLLCSVGTTWVSCRLELMEVAAELMRPKAPKAGKRVVLEYFPFIWKRLKFLQKVSARNIFRYKKRFFMMIVGISGCTALLVTGFGVRDSITGVVNQQYSEIQTFDLSLTYSEGVDATAEKELSDLAEEGVESYAFVAEKSVDLKTEDGTKSVNLVVLNPETDMSPFLNLHTTKKEPLENPKAGTAVICQKLAEDYDLKVGDTVTLRDEDMRTLEAEVSGICQNFVYNYVYLSADTYEEQFGEKPEYRTAYVKIAEGKDGHLLGTFLMNLKNVSAVSVNQDIIERFEGMMKSLDMIVLVIILCAAGLAFIVLYNLTNINITERVREIATIKVLGFYEKETASYVFRENHILSFLGALAGILLGRFLHAFVMAQIKVDMVTFDVLVRPVSYIYSVLLTMVFAWLVCRMMRGKIDRVSMTESLKSVD